MGGKSSKKNKIDDPLFGEGDELPEVFRQRRITRFKDDHNGKLPEHMNNIDAVSNFSLNGSMKSLKSNATVSDASWYTDNSSIRLIEYENYEYPFENVVFEGGGNKGLAYCGAVKVSELNRNKWTREIILNHGGVKYPGGATRVWFGWGRAAETWKVDPFLYQILTKNETHFFTRATNLKQNLLKISHFFPKLLSFQGNSGNFLYQIDEIGPIFAPILENFENMTDVYTSFCTK